jgi:hypothetical protein
MCLALSCPSGNRKILPVEILMEQQQGILPPLLLCTCSDGRHIHGNPWESEETWLQMEHPWEWRVPDSYGTDGTDAMFCTESNCLQTFRRFCFGGILPFCPTCDRRFVDRRLVRCPQGETNDWDRRTSSSSPSRWRERKLSLRNQKADNLKRFPKWSVGYWLGYFSNLIQFSLTSHGFSEAFAWAWNHWFKCVCL